MDDPAQGAAGEADPGGMQIGVLILLALVTVPLLGGRLVRLADLRLRLIGFAVAALAVQVLVVNVIPGLAIPHAAINISTYLVLGAVLVANLRVPGIAIVAAGGVANAAAILVNHGVMPAQKAALLAAGLEIDPAGYTNSDYVADARLWFLGDVFAIPASWPLSNVFSVGDILLGIGAGVVIHFACGCGWTTRLRRSPAAPAPAAA